MKRILVIAKHNPAEALRVAAGLTLLHETVRVTAIGELPDDPAVAEQRELLDFVDVPVDVITDPAAVAAGLAHALLQAEVVYTL
jgi:hypothetical protein